jgi:Sec-independent protein translocase protein TatA
VHNPADQDRADELKRIAALLGRSTQKIAQALNEAGKKMREAALSLQNTMNEFDREFKQAMKDNPPDDNSDLREAPFHTGVERCRASNNEEEHSSHEWENNFRKRICPGWPYNKKDWV